jgi:mRNA-degrading endonuclease toxin of MazEF toxin-antitoxin module
MKPGEIYWADLPDGIGRRPAIVVSREKLNRGNSVVMVLCTTGKFETRMKLPNCIPFCAGEFGFRQDCVAQCEAISLIPKQYLDSSNGPIGILPA